MEDIPKDIEKYLVKDEIIEISFKLHGCSVYASDRRLFLKKGNTVRDFSYSHISSIEFKKYRSFGPMVGGIFLTIFGFIVVVSVNAAGWIGVILGLAIFVAGFVPTNQVELTVVGLALPIKLSGDMVALDSLFKLIREKRT